jgi:hypothetical protein
MVVDVLEELVYVKYQKRNDIVIRCNYEDNPMGIISSDQNNIWHLEELVCFPVDGYETVKLIEIDKDEYDILKAALDENKEVIEPEPEPEPEEPEESEPTEEDIIDANTLELVRNSKITEMDKTCNQVITNGFDIVLSDELSHHFSLKITDQLKISKLNDRAEAGETLLPYHADNEECKFYSPEDIMAINTQMEYLIEYHTTYFNSLKTYIMALDNITEISGIYYGIEIPEEYQSEVMKVLLSNETT